MIVYAPQMSLGKRSQQVLRSFPLLATLVVAACAATPNPTTADRSSTVGYEWVRAAGGPAERENDLRYCQHANTLNTHVAGRGPGILAAANGDAAGDCMRHLGWTLQLQTPGPGAK